VQADWRRLRALVGFVVVLAVAGYTPVTRSYGAAPRPVLLGRVGRWFTDPTGRVVMLRGMNFVEK
jgi:hypothetical protein